MTLSTTSRKRVLAAGLAFAVSLSLTSCIGSGGAKEGEAQGVASQQAAGTEPLTVGAGADETADAGQSAEPGIQGEPAEETAPASTEGAQAKAAEIVAKMSLEEKVAQLFFVTPESLTGIGQAVAAGDSTRAAFEKRPVGGVIYFEQNLLDPAQTKEMLAGMQKISKEATGLPAFLGVDEEGGTVVRVGGRAGFGVKNPGDMRVIGDSGSTQAACDAATNIAGYLSNLGFNVDFAPVADIANTSSTTMSKRVFGATEAAVSPMVKAQVTCFSEAGMLTSAKHFPGIGGAQGDSHNDAIFTSETIDQWKAEELKPFEAAIEAGVPFIMVGHLTVKEATGSELPASLNPAVMADLLRSDMGYDGLIITDSLAMGAVTKFYAPEEVGLQALLAGADMVLMPLDFEASYQRLLAAARSGEISEARIDESVQRIVATKLAM